MARPVKSIADLTPDPKNARRHSPRNIGSIVNSLQKVGAARSIVIDEDGVILAGNGTVEAAGEAGITKVVTVDADGETIVAVRRTGLTPKQKAELAIADNRTSDLSEFDAGVLEQLAAEHDLDLSTLDISEGELESWRETPAREQTDTRSEALRTNKTPTVKVVLAVADVELFERAVAMTGLMNRGEAVMKIVGHYVSQTGQQYGSAKGGAAAAGAGGPVA